MKPLVRTSFSGGGFPDALIEIAMGSMNLTRRGAISYLQSQYAKSEVWINDKYQVTVDRESWDNDIVQIVIRARDGSAIMRDWRDFQEIKNQLLGDECEAVELYPAESRLVDTSNKYHLWGISDPTFRFPVGWRKREVSSTQYDAPGLKQRPFNYEPEQTTGNEVYNVIVHTPTGNATLHGIAATNAVDACERAIAIAKSHGIDVSSATVV